MINIGYGLIDKNNTKDVDLFNIIDSNEMIYYRKFGPNKEDICVISTTFLNKFLNFNLPTEKEYLYAFLWQLDYNINPTAKSLNFNYLDNKNKIDKIIDKFIEDKKFNFNTDITTGDGFMSKMAYHIVINKFFLENNSMTLTKEQFNDITKIHDRKMSWEEFLQKYNYYKE